MYNFYFWIREDKYYSMHFFRSFSFYFILYLGNKNFLKTLKSFMLKFNKRCRHNFHLILIGDLIFVSLYKIWNVNLFTLFFLEFIKDHFIIIICFAMTKFLIYSNLLHYKKLNGLFLIQKNFDLMIFSVIW